MNKWLKTEEFQGFEKICLKLTKELFEEDLKKLDNIFVDNPNSWAKKATYYNIYSNDYLEFLKMIKAEIRSGGFFFVTKFSSLAPTACGGK